jgi:transcriptional regulator with XRE-family HTH domain
MLVCSEKIKTMRLEHGWTQDQLAEMCGLSVRTVQRIEKDGVASIDTTNALAAVLKTERQALLVQDVVKPARADLSVRHVVLIATMTFLLGIGIGAIV